MTETSLFTPGSSQGASSLQSERKTDGATTSSYVGPAVVEQIKSERVITVRRSDGEEHEARMAAHLPYRLTEGDEVLVVAKEAAHYVISLSKPKEQTVLQTTSDLRLEAQRGDLSLVASAGVSMRGEAVNMHAKGRHLTDAGRVQVRATERWTHVEGVLNTQTRDATITAERGLYQKARGMVMKVSETLRLRGKDVHLG